MELHPILERGDTPSSDLWYVLSATGAPCCRVGQACVYDSRHHLYVIGGADPSTAYSDCFRYDLKRHLWTKLSDEKYAACYEHCAFLPDFDKERIYLFGGATKDSNLNSVQALDIGSGEVQAITCTGQAPTPRTLHSAAWSDNQLYVWSGGLHGSNPVPDLKLHVFEADSKCWRQPSLKGKLPSARHGHVMVLSERSIYIHGGMSGSTFHKDLHAINLHDYNCSKLQAKGDVPSARAAHAACAYKQLIYIFGGLCAEGALDDVHQFDTATLVWTKMKFDSPPPTCRLDHSMVLASFPITAKAKADKEKSEDPPLSEVPTASASTPSNHHKPNIVPLDDWHTSDGNSDVKEAGDQLAASLTLSDGEEQLNVVETVPVLLVFGGMDTSGNLFNDLMLLRLDG